VPPGWYPDPAGRHEYRYWDGSLWTDDVSSHGRQSTDALHGKQPKIPTVNRATDKVVRDVDRSGLGTGATGGGTCSPEPVLVVNQKAKLIEVNNEYAVYDQQATQIGAVREVGQNKAKKAVRMLTSLDQFFTHKLQVVDKDGMVRLQLTRPAK